MKANKFVKKFGWDEIQVVITNADTKATHIRVYEHDTILIDYIHWDGLRISLKQNGEWVKLSRKYQNAPDFICIADLERLVESHELVESYGGLENTKDEYFSCVQNAEPASHISRAIEDVESCM